MTNSHEDFAEHYIVWNIVENQFYTKTVVFKNAFYINIVTNILIIASIDCLDRENKKFGVIASLRVTENTTEKLFR